MSTLTILADALLAADEDEAVAQLQALPESARHTVANTWRELLGPTREPLYARLVLRAEPLLLPWLLASCSSSSVVAALNALDDETWDEMMSAPDAPPGAGGGFLRLPPATVLRMLRELPAHRQAAWLASCAENTGAAEEVMSMYPRVSECPAKLVDYMRRRLAALPREDIATMPFSWRLLCSKSFPECYTSVQLLKVHALDSAELADVSYVAQFLLVADAETWGIFEPDLRRTLDSHATGRVASAFDLRPTEALERIVDGWIVSGLLQRAMVDVAWLASVTSALQLGGLRRHPLAAELKSIAAAQRTMLSWPMGSGEYDAGRDLVSRCSAAYLRFHCRDTMAEVYSLLPSWTGTVVALAATANAIRT